MTARHEPDRAAAVVDFVLVAALLSLIFVGLVQLAVVLHVRNTLIDCAAEAARYGALADRTPSDGVARARALIAQDLSARYAQDVRADREQVDGLDTVVIRVKAPLPVLGLVGAGHLIDVAGHAVLERP
ncbi:MAG TPA: TadE family protein [Kineosporiaceae bacterium]|nr:TadE family protein [Kineosporiaceae bacterium]